MADNFNAKDASGATVTVGSDQVVDGTLGTVQVQYVKLMDGTLDGTTKAAVGAAGLKVDGSGATQPVSGTVTVTQATAANLKVDLSGTAANTTALKVDGSAVTQPTSAADGGIVAIGATTDVETASGNGSGISIWKRIRTLLGAGLPAALGGSGGLKVEVITGIAAARTTDSISSALATDAIMSGLTALTPKFAPITASASGATTIIAAVAAKKLRILGGFLVCTSAVTVKFQSHTTTATATGTMPFGANGGIAIPFMPVGCFETVAGEALDINLGGAVAVGGQLVYVEV